MLAIGQGTVARVVAATGPVQVSGVDITGDNAQDFLAKGIYARFTDVAEKNSFVQKLMFKLFKNLASAKLDLKSVWQNLLSEQSGDQVYGWSSDPAAERLFNVGGVSGQVSPNFGSKVYLSFNNAGANKLDAYLHVGARYQLGVCGASTTSGFKGREATLKIRLDNQAPNGLPNYVSPIHPTYLGTPIKVSTNRTIFSIYAPVGSSRLNFKLDGKPIYASDAIENGRPVWVLDISVEPGRPRNLLLKWVEPIENADGKSLHTSPQIIVPSAFNPIQTSVSSSGACTSK